MGTKDYFSRKRVILEYPDCTSEYIVYIDQVNLFHWHVTYAWGLQDIEIDWICPPPQMENGRIRVLRMEKFMTTMRLGAPPRNDLPWNSNKILKKKKKERKKEEGWFTLWASRVDWARSGPSDPFNMG